MRKQTPPLRAVDSPDTGQTVPENLPERSGDARDLAAAQNNDAGRAVQENLPEQGGGQARDLAAAQVEATCADIMQSDEEMTRFLDDHWHKLRLLVGLLNQEDADASTVGSLLADVAESFITQVEAFDRAPVSTKLKVVDELVNGCEVLHG